VCTPVYICASYQYAVLQVKQNEELVVRERIANACIDDPSHSFWAEVKTIHHGNTGNSIIVDHMHFLPCLFTYYLCRIYVLEVRINIIIII